MALGWGENQSDDEQIEEFEGFTSELISFSSNVPTELEEHAGALTEGAEALYDYALDTCGIELNS